VISQYSRRERWIVVPGAARPEIAWKAYG
jgi:hypothetical protein